MKSLLLAALMIATPSIAAAQTRSEVPIREVDLSDQTRRYVVQIKVGETAIDAGLDTGSTGIRILPGVLKGSDANETSRKDAYSYGSGAKYDGVIGNAQVTIAGASGSAPVQLIKKVGCLEAMPRCPVVRTSPEKYGIQGDGLPGEGFKAILGINMGRSAAANPLPLLGAKRWIIELPLPGSGKPGRIILNPTAAESAGYITFDIDRRFAQEEGGMHDAIPACLVNTAVNQGFCGATLLDTGAPGIVVINGRGQIWSNDTPAAFVFGDKTKTAVGFKIGYRDFASRLTYTPRPQVSDQRIHAGLTPYFAYSVLYDADAGTVALKPRADTKMAIQ
ncbi:MAG TPA: hypothetical protein VFN88_04705 [Caulobacteraceae bacterium]|nr:hypothetical protein [Caulobacteraceae bacterium]